MRQTKTQRKSNTLREREERERHCGFSSHGYIISLRGSFSPQFCFDAQSDFDPHCNSLSLPVCPSSSLSLSRRCLMWWHPGIVLAIVPVWKEGRRDRDRWRDGIAVLMWHWGPSKVENLDIIDSYTGRSGIPIRMRWNVLELSEMTSVNSSEGPAGSRTRISSYHHHKYQTFMFLIIPPALVYLPLHCPYLCCLCRDRVACLCIACTCEPTRCSTV